MDIEASSVLVKDVLLEGLDWLYCSLSDSMGHSEGSRVPVNCADFTCAFCELEGEVAMREVNAALAARAATLSPPSCCLRYLGRSSSMSC